MENNKRSPFISVIISTRDTNVEILKKTIFSIFNSDLTNFEIIIVDQNKNDEIKRFISSVKKEGFLRRGKLIYTKSKEVGLSRGRNLGIKYARGEWLLFLDDDAILPKELFKKIEPVLKKEKEFVFYGKVLTLDRSIPFIKRHILTSRLHLWNFDSVCSVALLFNQKVLKKIGGFDERFGVGSKFGAGEEGDMVIRALREGFKINYLKNFVVYHPSPKPDLKKRFSYGCGVGALYRKHIFCSFYFLFVLGLKFTMEIGLRAILGVIFIPINIQKSKLHLNYLKGFITCFLSYTNENSSIW